MYHLLFGSCSLFLNIFAFWLVFTSSTAQLAQQLASTSSTTAANLLIDGTGSFDNFSILGPTEVQLPKENVTLQVAFDDVYENTDDWTFYWMTVEGVGLCYADAYDKSKLELTQLQPGTIRLRVTVSNDGVSGFKDHVLKIIPAPKANIKPIAVVKPSSPVVVVENSQLVLNAEGSRDDDGKIVSYEWHLKKGPSAQLPSALNTPILTVSKLSQGNYTFSLKVVDDAGESGETEVDVYVNAERDDPPKARISQCGDSAIGSITVRLPLEELYLCGNSSTDDVHIEQFKWARIDNLSNLPIDYTGSTTSILKLTNLQSNEQLGPYIFQLEVFDGKGQKDSATLSIFVNQAENLPPKADAGKNMTVILPENSVVLSGLVKDDGTVSSYKWTQISGPSLAVIINDDKMSATITNLMEGIYCFSFNVTDDGGLSDTSDVFVTVQRSQNEPPIARAENVSVSLPQTIARLDASKSTDDAGVVEYRWVPFDNVPACVSALDNSDAKPVLLLNGLVAGEFFFNLTVFDQQRATSSAIVKLSVSLGSEQLNSVEMYMRQHLNDITYHLRRKLEDRLTAALNSQIQESSAVDVRFTEFGQDPKNGNLRVVFYASYLPESQHGREMRDVKRNEYVVIESHRAVTILQRESIMIQEFGITQIDSLYCQRACSHHGRCNNFTKECECETYWMGNLFTQFSSGKQLDCNWSKLYFFITSATVASLVLVFIGCCTTFKRRIRRNVICQSLIPCLSSAKESLRRKRFRRRKRYEPLDQENVASVNMMSSSSLHSDSDESLFEVKSLRDRSR